MLPRNAGWRQRTTCADCGYLVTATWTDGAILLAAYPAALPRRDAAPRPPGRLDPPVYPQTRMEPVYPPPPGPAFVPAQGPEARHAGDPRPRRGPRPDDGPDWEGARRRVSRAMNGLR